MGAGLQDVLLLATTDDAGRLTEYGFRCCCGCRAGCCAGLKDLIEVEEPHEG